MEKWYYHAENCSQNLQLTELPGYQFIDLSKLPWKTDGIMCGYKDKSGITESPIILWLETWGDEKGGVWNSSEKSPKKRYGQKFKSSNRMLSISETYGYHILIHVGWSILKSTEIGPWYNFKIEKR